MKRGTGYTLVEVCVVILAIGMAITLATAGLDEQKRNKLQLRNTTQVRGIIQSMVTHGSDNGEYYPGLDAQGKVIDVSTAGVFQIMLENNAFTGEYAISPVEDLKPWRAGRKATVDNLSYAILDVDISAGKTDRFKEWRQTINTQAVTISDRNTGAEDGYASVWTPHVQAKGWSGSVGRNDGSASFEMSPVLDDTKYGHGDLNEHDHLFESKGGSDALMTFFKDDEGKETPVPARNKSQTDGDPSE